jgi:hypothetical protein
MLSLVRWCSWFVIGMAASACPELREYAPHCVSETFRTPIKQFSICSAFFIDTCLHSDDSGKVVITIPESSAFSYTVSAPGYQDTVLTFENGQPIPETLVLKGNELDRLPNLTVTAASTPGPLAPYRQSLTAFDAIDLTTTAGAVEDIGRYIGTLPSTVSSIGEGYDNTFFVRGGRPSEIVFLVDGIEMENINHFSKANGSGGPIGFINSDYLDKVQFLAGNMPVSSPPRLSSTVDIRMKNGSFSKTKQSAGCKLTGGMVSAEGPLAVDKSSFIAAGRYVDFKTLRTFTKDAGVPKLYDVFGKVAILAGESMDLSATGIFSNSTYRYNYHFQPSDNGTLFDNVMNQKERIDQGGAGVSLHYNHGAISHVVNASLSFRNGANTDSLAHFSDSFYTSNYARNPVTQLSDGRRHLTVSAKSNMPLFGEDNLLSFGVRLNRNDYSFSMSDQSQHSGRYIFCNGALPDTIVWQLNPNEKSICFGSMESGAFLEYFLNRGILQASGGLRADYYGLLSSLALSPRLSGSLQFGNAGIFSGNFGLYHQFPTDMPSCMFSFFSQKTDISNDSVKALEEYFMGHMQPLRCLQGSCGYERSFFSGIETRVEAYYKWYDREYSYVSPTWQYIFSIDSKGRMELRDQDGKRKAYGVELSIRNRHDRRLFYSLAGSLFDVKNKYGDGTWHNDWTNMGHTYSIDVGSLLRKRHMLSISLRGSGGRPMYGQTIFMDCRGRKSAVPDTASSFFSQRLKSLSVANLRYEYSMKIGGMEVDAFIEALNIFNYTPTLEYKFNGDHFVEIKPFGFTPILGCTVHW